MRIGLATAIAVFLAFGLVSCTGHKSEEKKENQQAPASAPATAAQASQPVMTRAEAEARAKQVSHPSYVQTFKLEADKETFSGTVDIAFEWRAPAAVLKVDFFGGKVLHTRFNDRDVELPYDGKQITLDAKLRGEGVQHLFVQFEHRYDPEANGLYRFVDPEDKKVYLYSNLEPNFASVIFPCFDQPDLKATFQMTVAAPAEWIVTTATLPTATSAKDSIFKIWEFPASSKMATYVWSLHAGAVPCV